eukprot:1159878-Pelagomonas_calceolata.AAC.3
MPFDSCTATPTASGQLVDPFSRTNIGPTQPQEQSWRAAVSATPAAYQSLVPQNDLYGDPQVHAACMPLPQPPFPRKPPTTATAGGGAPTQELSARLFKNTQVGRREQWVIRAPLHL